MNVVIAKPQRDSRREIILSIAREVFMEEGYAAASMSTIAARLGGSKGTLYCLSPSSSTSAKSARPNCSTGSTLLT